MQFQIKSVILYRKETFDLCPRKQWSFIGNVEIIIVGCLKKDELKVNKPDRLCKLCECNTENLMHVLCDCETIKEFWKCVIDLINVNINNNRYRYVENDVILGCLDKNLNLKEKQT